jgi:hypothetical protein
LMTWIRTSLSLSSLGISQVWSVLSGMTAWHWSWARLTRHSKILIRLRCMDTKSLQILMFLSNHAGLSALSSRGTWPDYSCMQSREIWGFKRWSSHASLPVCFWLSVRAIRCWSHLAQPCKVFHIWGKDVICTKWNKYIENNISLYETYMST